MADRSELWLQRYLAVRRPVEVGLWVVIVLAQAAANTVTTGIDLQRVGVPFAGWQVATWELSSAVVWLALIPAIVAMLDRKPLVWGRIRRHLPWHAAASLACSAMHVGAMVALRHAVYALQGDSYDFGDWATGLRYEALKDVRSYIAVVAGVLSYRLLLWRWQGEARWLAPPETTAAPASTQVPQAATAFDAEDRPERLLVKKLGKEFLIPVAEIEWVQACGNYVNLHRQQHDYPLRTTLAAIEKRLDPVRFVRVHRSYLVNLSLVRAIEPTEAGDARLRLLDGSSVPCSRTHLEPLRQRAARPLVMAMERGDA